MMVAITPGEAAVMNASANLSAPGARLNSSHSAVASPRSV